MKVTFFTHYGDYAYGANRSLINLVDGLKEYDIQMLVVYPDEGTLEDALANRAVRGLKYPLACWVSTQFSLAGSLTRLAKNIYYAISLSRVLLDWDCDIAYTNTSVIPIGQLISIFTGRPHVWHIREFGDLDHGLKPDFGRLFHCQVIGLATAKVAVSEAVRSYVLPGNLSKNSYVIYNGIAFKEDFDRYLSLNRKFEKNHGDFTFAIIGLIHTSKGHEDAIRALARVAKKHSGVRLLVVGSGFGKDVQRFRDLAIELGVAEKVEFCGYLDDPYDAYFKAEAVLVCSRNEGMGRVAVEAMSACRPVIGFDNAGTSELIRDGYNGLLYRSGYQELADRMEQLLYKRSWARELGMNGWHIAREEYSIEKYAHNVYEVLNTVGRSSAAN